MRVWQRALSVAAPGLVLTPLVAAAQVPDARSMPAPTTQATAAAVPQGFTYSPEGRRDPFVSLLRRGAGGPPMPGARPAGLAGLAVSEVSLKGTLASRDGQVALMQGADDRTYIVRPGDRLLDGTVRTITEDAVVIVQQVDDPLSRQREREVRKVLRQMDGVQ